MNQLSNVGKIVLVAVVAAILIILLIVYGAASKNPSTAANNASGTGAGTAASGTVTIETTSTTSTAPGQAATPIAPVKTTAAPAKTTTSPAQTIKFVTPVAGDSWTIGQQNLISWSKPGNFTGWISLLNATNKQLVGVILPNTGPNQSSYTWNTIGVYLNRTSPNEVDVVPGSYVIQVSFDNNLKSIISPAFTIVN